MKQAIIIATYPTFKPWLINFLKTYNHTYDILITYNTKESNRYDPQAVIAGIESNYDEFLVLHDTLEIKDNTLFDIVFKEHQGKSVFFREKSCMFLAKYTKKDLSNLNKSVIQALYDITDKMSAVRQESEFNYMYRSSNEVITLFDDLKDNGQRDIKFGRRNMVLENKYIKKYKGSWDGDTVAKSLHYIPTEE